MSEDYSALTQRPIALVGMMGVGKTTVGRRLAKRLSLPFFDSDDEIELASGRTVKGYFRDHGEAAFRQGERRVIRRLLSGEPIILATGGGAFIPEPTRKVIRKRALTVWLRAEHSVILDRVSRKNTRPLLDVPNKAEKLQMLIDERYPIYAQDDIVVDSNDGPHARTVDKILKAALTHLAPPCASRAKESS